MRILVTRPRAEAERTAARLVALGHEPLVAPVLAIEPTGEAPPRGPFGAILLTSANAVPALSSIVERGVPVFAISARLASTVRDLGFGDVRAGEGDAGSLAALIAGYAPVGTRLLHIAGRDRKAEPEASLAAAGFPVATWVSYAAIAADRLPDPARDALAGRRLDAALHYSRRSAALVLELADRAGQLAPFLSLRHGCLSDDAAEPLARAGARWLAVAWRPDEDGLLAALAREIVPDPSRWPGRGC